jgi:hypothetical protein
VSWEVEVWAMLSNPIRVTDVAALSAHLDDLGVVEATDLLQFDEAEVVKIAAFLKKVPQKKLLQIYREAMAKA